MFLSKTSVGLGTAAVWIAAWAALNDSKTGGVGATVLAVLAWHFQQRAASQAQAKTDERADRLEDELSDLKRKDADRKLPAEELDKLKSLLRASRDKGRVEVYQPSQWGDHEEYSSFAAQLLTTLSQAGWPATHVIASDDAFPPNPRGIAIRVRDTNTAPRHAHSLQSALRAVGVDTPSLSTDRSLETNTVGLFVHRKPK